MKKTQENQSPELILEKRIERLQRGREWKRSLLDLALFAALIYVVFFHIVGIGLVNGDSMAPTLLDGEAVLFYRLDSQYHPGDIVLFRGQDQIPYVKRVIAAEGDLVEVDSGTGTLRINQEPVEEPYVYTRTLPTSEKITFPLVVQPGEVFVLGDNRENSRDSREFGCIPASEITGRVILHAGSLF